MAWLSRSQVLVTCRLRFCCVVGSLRRLLRLGSWLTHKVRYCFSKWLGNAFSRLRWLLRDFGLGVESGYPLCCIIQFSVERFLRGTNYVSNRGQVVKGRLILDYVPCYLHMTFCRTTKDGSWQVMKDMGFPKAGLELLFPDRPELRKKLEEDLSRTAQ